MTFGPVFDIGSMAGLITLFGRHSGLWTNFSIFEVRSRPYWSQEEYIECEEPGCAEGAAGPWSARVDAETLVTGTGWALAILIWGPAGYYPV